MVGEVVEGMREGVVGVIRGSDGSRWSNDGGQGVMKYCEGWKSLSGEIGGTLFMPRRLQNDP